MARTQKRKKQKRVPVFCAVASHESTGSHTKIFKVESRTSGGSRGGKGGANAPPF